MSATVELNLFSGLPNPKWEITDAQARKLIAALHELPVLERGVVPVAGYAEPLGRPRSGYRGLSITYTEAGVTREVEVFNQYILDGKTGQVHVDALRSLEKELYEAAGRPLIDDLLQGMTYAQLTTTGHEARIEGLERAPTGLACPTALPYVGDTGDFHTFRLRNNCYNYATNVVNKVVGRPASPGTPDVRPPLTKAALKHALDDDLLPLGLSLPRACPPEGSHYLAVLLRFHPAGPVKDFHCLRLDRNGVWSHKDGKDAVRDVDDNGNQITDLASAAFSWTPELVGFYQFAEADRGKIK